MGGRTTITHNFNDFNDVTNWISCTSGGTSDTGPVVASERLGSGGARVVGTWTISGVRNTLTSLAECRVLLRAHTDNISTTSRTVVN